MIKNAKPVIASIECAANILKGVALTEATLTRDQRYRDLWVVLLTAGKSSRFGKHNKLLAPWQGKTVLDQVITHLMQADIRNIQVVTGHDHKPIQEICEKWQLFWHHNPNYAAGMGSSIAIGAKAVPPNASAIMILPADLPTLKPQTLRTIACANAPLETSIVVPHLGEKRGHPVRFGKAFREELEALDGKQGGRAILMKNSHAVKFLQVYDTGIIEDIDTLDTYQLLKRKTLSAM